MSDNFLNDFIKREMDAQIEKNNKKIEEIMNKKGIKSVYDIDCLLKDEFGNVLDVLPKKIAMKKLFISLPMAGLTTEEIRSKMIKYKENAERIMGEKLEIINTTIVEAPNNVKNCEIWCLGESIMMMADADVVYFGRGWRSDRGCIAESMVAYRYKILRIEDDPYWGIKIEEGY